MHAEDIPRESKLPCVQRPIKRAEVEKYTISYREEMRRWGENIFRAQKTIFPVWFSYPTIAIWRRASESRKLSEEESLVLLSTLPGPYLKGSVLITMCNVWATIAFLPLLFILHLYNEWCHRFKLVEKNAIPKLFLSFFASLQSAYFIYQFVFHFHIIKLNMSR